MDKNQDMAMISKIETPPVGPGYERGMAGDRLHAIMGMRTVGILFWGPDFTIVEANDAFLRMAGYDRAALLGARWQDLTPPEFRAASERAVEEVITLGEATPYEKQYTR